MKSSLGHWTRFVFLCGSLASVIDSSAFADTVRIVSPPSAIDAEGPDFRRPNPVSHRIQQLVPASDFASLPELNHLLVAFNYRADRSQRSSADWGIGTEQIWMSTTPLDVLTNVFADNHGADKILVYDGPINYSLLGTGPANGPRDIANGPRLQTPFPYDPSQGNLLIDRLVIRDNPTPQANIDVHLTQTERLLINDVDAHSATGDLLTSGAVFQFEFATVPEPTSMSLAGLSFAYLFFWSKRRCGKSFHPETTRNASLGN